MSKHRQASPDCPFVRNLSDNVPLVAGSGSGNNSAEEQSGVPPLQPADSGFGSQEEADDAGNFSFYSSGTVGNL
jgi:hypothetical protein